MQRHTVEAARRLVAWAVAGVEPKHMGIGPAPAARKALDKAKMKLEQMDLVEVNEAFAPQYSRSSESWDSIVPAPNACGGAIAIGHPLAATGTTHHHSPAARSAP